MGAKLKVRQPLAKVEVILADREHQAWLEEHRALVAEELNVKQVEYPPRADQYISYTMLPDLKRLGPRLGKRLPAVESGAGRGRRRRAAWRSWKHGRQVTIELPDGPVTLDGEDMQVRLQAKPGWAAAQGPAGVVVLSTELTPELVAEGTARELVHAIPAPRRDIDCQYTDRIVIGIVTDDVGGVGRRRAIRRLHPVRNAGRRHRARAARRRRAADASRSARPTVQLYVKVVSAVNAARPRSFCFEPRSPAATGGADFRRRDDAATI